MACCPLERTQDKQHRFEISKTRVLAAMHVLKQNDGSYNRTMANKAPCIVWPLASLFSFLNIFPLRKHREVSQSTSACQTGFFFLQVTKHTEWNWKFTCSCFESSPFIYSPEEKGAIPFLCAWKMKVREMENFLIPSFSLQNHHCIWHTFLPPSLTDLLL